MAATRKSPDPGDDAGGGADTEDTGFTEDQRNEIAAIVAKAIGGGAPSAGKPSPVVPKVTDDEYDRMTDRQREGFIRSVVVDTLEGLAKDDEAARLRDDVDALKQDKGKPEPEAPPSVVTRIQRILWGDPKE